MKIIVVLKHIFIPHDNNDYKPHFFRELGVSIFLFTSVFLLGSSFGSSFLIHKTVMGAEIAASVLIDLTNESRLAYNQQPLVRNIKLDNAAELKGKDMADKQYFSHDSPEGVTPWYWFRQAGYNFLYAGENLAINFTDSSEVEEAWLGSPTHRANIMNAQFREIGIATVQGFYNNYPTIYVVQMFGTPARAQNYSNIDESELIKEQPKKLVINKVSTSSESVQIVSTSTDTLVIGDVKGESIESTSSKIQKIVSNNDLIVVKNVSAIENQNEEIKQPPTYSTWYQKVLFMGSRYVDTIYKIMLILVAFALVTMILVEIRKQHFVHILYGVSLLFLLMVFIYINQSFF
jgi:hypothetical protein